MRNDYSEGELRAQAAEALVNWRRQWERENCEGPSIDSGFRRSDLRLWRIAGGLMLVRGIKPRLP